ncbi:hypothetical protein VitviT2T_001529 [Vitis vinifera]|uniref:Protein kinase domain-containing protein n=3 Tax=Vitis vinifera TaxID=29760 RepID=A0ABY9BFT1_VITVI|nr:LRR receptor-like serine/threonine-protein kinase GSO1 [Vitis vinifera]WJZ81704.1 hypothetical protein VitviT2T_001529 [Vitis vinifera]
MNDLYANPPQMLNHVRNVIAARTVNCYGSIAALCSSHSFLLSFDVTNNAFDGQIPRELGFSPSLQRLRLGINHFTGAILRTLGEIYQLSLVDFSGNSLTGSVPAELSLCKKLTHIDLNNNFLSGPIPSWLGSLPNLGELKLSFTLFSGPLPHELFKCSNLLVLSLDNNLLNGTLPLETGNLASLNVLNLNQNQFYGPIPPAIGNLSKLYELRLSRNSFNGEIPIELRELQNLRSVLDLSYNNLTGEIPPSIGTLSKLEALDLSHNQLGEILFQVGAMSSLGKLNFSYNNLEGKLDKEFLHWPAETFMGNLRLCGGPLGRCNSEESSHHNSGLKLSSVVIISAFSTIAAIVLLMIGVALFLKGKRESLNEVKCVYSSSSSIVHRRPLLPNAAGKRDFKWGDIMQATNNLSDNFIIGSGGSGTIYKAELSSEETVAVKKILRKDDLLLNKSFEREIRTLERVRHRHLAKLLGCCVNKEAGFNLLVYEYMENGSLWDWLHPESVSSKKRKSLDWEARLRVAAGLAKGVEYLHHDCVLRIIHRDIKSSNVLLDSNMEAHLGDFELAKTLVENHNSFNTDSNSWFAGSYGYIAPEYAYSLKATEKSDVYSMGIVLVELVSGKMPTDEIFGTDKMVRWVESHIEMGESSRTELIDSALKPILPDEECAAFGVLEIAPQCTKTTPAERPSSRQVCDSLVHLSNNRNRMVGCYKNPH